MKGLGDDWSSESRTEWRVMWGEWVWRLCSSLHCTRAALGSPQRLSIPWINPGGSSRCAWAHLEWELWKAGHSSLFLAVRQICEAKPFGLNGVWDLWGRGKKRMVFPVVEGTLIEEREQVPEPGQALLPVLNLPGGDWTQNKWDQGIAWENALVGTIVCVKFKVCVAFFPQGFCPWILRSLVSVKLSWFTSIIWVCSLYILLIIIFTVSVDFGFTFLTGSPLPWSSGHTLSIFQHSSCPTKSQKFEHSVLSRAFSLLSPFHSSCLA